jgi:DNA-binding Xre family transcriptional regulator
MRPWRGSKVNLRFTGLQDMSNQAKLKYEQQKIYERQKEAVGKLRDRIIAEIGKHDGMRREDVAGLAGISRQTLQKLIATKISSPKVDTLTGLEEALKLKPGDLVRFIYSAFIAGDVSPARASHSLCAPDTLKVAELQSRVCPGLPAELDPSVRGPLGNQLRDYYGEKRCVIDGNLDNSNIVNWVPFDGDIANLGFTNLVPVGHQHLLQVSPRVRGKLSKTRFCFSVYLTAEKLLHKPKEHFHEGMPALAFGCSRLGEALALEFAKDFKAQDDDGWAFLSQSLFYLPYRMNIGLLEITLRRVMLWLEKGLEKGSPCSYARRSELLLSIANLYQDMGDWDSAKNLYDKILSSPGLKPETEAATLRRRMIGRYFIAAPSERLLLRDISYIKDLNSDTDFRVSLAIAQGWWHIARDQPRKCLSILEPFDSDEDDSMQNYSPHNIFELKLTLAAASKALRLNPTPILDEVQKYAHTRSYTRLRPITTDHIASAVFGDELGRAIVPLSSTFVVTSSMLNWLKEVADALLTARCTEPTGRPTWVD